MTTKSWKALQARAAEELARGDLEKATHTLVEAAELAPNEPRLYEQLVRVALLDGRTQTAVSAAFELRRLEPYNPQYAYLHAVASMAHGDVEGARGILDEALRHAPKSWEVRQALAQVSRLLKDDARAKALLAEAVALAPTEPGPVNDYALLLLEGDEAGPARAALDTALAVHGDDPALNLNAALACAKLGDAEGAVRHAEKAKAGDGEMREQAERLLAQLVRH